jgi:transposase
MPPSLLAFAASLPQGSKVALEATNGWYYFYELLEEHCGQIVLAHPLKTRAIAEARIKTDSIDATTLAHLLRTDLLPTSYIAPREIRDTREVLRYRASLVSLQTSLKNKVHAILDKNGIHIETSDIFGKKAVRRLRDLQVRTCYRHEIDGYLRLMETLGALLKEVDEKIKELVRLNANATLLLSVPGIGHYSALLITSEIGDITRFSSGKKLCSYAGLVPCVYSSGGKTRHGAITKQGSKWLRWILIELSHHFATSSPRMKAFYGRIAYKHGKNTARVAVAREMLKIIYVMLTHKRPFLRE